MGGFKRIFRQMDYKQEKNYGNLVGLVSSGASLTSWGEGASLALVGNPSSDGATIKMPYPPGLCNTGLASSGEILTSWGERASLALIGHPSSDGITIKMPYGIHVLH